MQAIWRFLQNFGVDLPRPKVLATALLVLFGCLALGLLLAVFWENPMVMAMIGRQAKPQMRDLMAYGLDAKSAGCFAIYAASLAWVAAGGAGARVIWACLLLMGALMVAALPGLALLLDLHAGPALVAMLVARGLLCLGLLAGMAMLCAPEVSAWRKDLLKLRQAQSEARRARRLARQ